MKYVIVLPDGATDENLQELGSKTPLATARIPNMDWVASHGQLGRTVTIPEGFTPGTDVGTLSVLGYDPHRYYSGRAPIEAAAQGLTVRPDQLIFRCNFVTIADGVMKDFTAGHIAQPDADELDRDAQRRDEGRWLRVPRGRVLSQPDAALRRERHEAPHDAAARHLGPAGRQSTARRRGVGPRHGAHAARCRARRGSPAGAATGRRGAPSRDQHLALGTGATGPVRGLQGALRRDRGR